MTQEQIEAVRRDISALRNGLLYPWQHDAAKDRILATIDRLTKERDEAQEGQELAKEEGISETLALLDRLTGGDGEYFASTRPGRGCPDEAAMQAKIVARFDALTKERDEARKVIEDMRATAVYRRAVVAEARTSLSAMQEAIAEAVRRADTETPFKTHVIVSDVVEPLRPFVQTKQEPEVDPLVQAVKDSIEGWNNVVEMGLLPPQHHETAHRLSERLYTALASLKGQSGNG